MVFSKIIQPHAFKNLLKSLIAYLRTLLHKLKGNTMKAKEILPLLTFVSQEIVHPMLT